jgi:predicted RNase H-like HicB family nuclease
MRFTVILTPDVEDGGFVAECPAIPGCISEGATVDASLQSIKEGCLESLAARNEPLPQQGEPIVASVEANLPALVKP